MANCKGLVTEYEVCDALKQIGLKSPGLDGLPDIVYLRQWHMFAYSDGLVQPLV